MRQHITFSETLHNLFADFSKYSTSKNPFFFSAVMFHNSGMIFSLIFRIEQYLLYGVIGLKPVGLILYPLYFFVTYYILDYHIEPGTNIGPGLLLHNKNIVITEGAVLGSNVEIMDSVTIGVDFVTGGTIAIGDNVKMGSGAKIISNKKLTITSNVVIGANAVVVKSITKSGTYVGIPAKLVKKRK